MEHLSETAKTMLSRTDDERIESINNSKWIGYGKGKKILDRMDYLIKHTPSHRMPNMLLIGATNNGKTVLLHRFCSLNDSYMDDETSRLVIPVLYIQAPPEPSEGRLYNVILDKLFAPYKFNDKPEKKAKMVIQLLHNAKTKVLIIDEIHHILAGTMMKQRTFLNVLKYISNELCISIICAGTKAAHNALQTDPQLANRFEPAILTKWKLDDEYFRLLASFEYMLPLKKPSGLAEDDALALKILSMSEGHIGEISNLLKEAATEAIKSGEERITKKILSSLPYYKSPSERKSIYSEA